MNIGKALIKVRKDLKITQFTVCVKTGITQSYLSQIESGKKIPSIQIIEKLANFYDIPFQVIAWFSIEESEVKPDRIYDFRYLKPHIDQFINQIFLKEIK